MTDKHKLQDIAALAGVGIATVDRVLNERGNVSAKTAQRVLDAARQLNLRRVLPSSHRRLLRICVLLPRPELPLITRMNHEFSRLAERLDRSVQIVRTVLATEDPATIERQLAATNCDAVVVYAQEHDRVHEAIAELEARGVPVVTMISDLPRSQRLAYAGTDHYAAGRTAAYFMARIVHRPGPLLVLCNHLGFESHESRLRGFRDGLKHYAPTLEINSVIEGRDDSTKSELLLREAFRSFGRIAGLYNVGAANDACGASLRSNILSEVPVFIGHELNQDSRPLLEGGLMALAIDQNPEHQARFALDVLLHHFGYAAQTWMKAPYVSNVSIRLFSPENLTVFSGPPHPND